MMSMMYPDIIPFVGRERNGGIEPLAPSDVTLLTETKWRTTMEIYVGVAVIIALMAAMAMLFPAFGKGMGRVFKATFYLIVLVMIMGWTLFKGLLQAGFQRLAHK